MTPFMTPNSHSSRSNCFLYNTISIDVFIYMPQLLPLGAASCLPASCTCWPPRPQYTSARV